MTHRSFSRCDKSSIRYIQSTFVNAVRSVVSDAGLPMRHARVRRRPTRNVHMAVRFGSSLPVRAPPVVLAGLQWSLVLMVHTHIGLGTMLSSHTPDISAAVPLDSTAASSSSSPTTTSLPHLFLPFPTTSFVFPRQNSIHHNARFLSTELRHYTSFLVPPCPSPSSFVSSTHTHTSSTLVREVQAPFHCSSSSVRE